MDVSATVERLRVPLCFVDDAHRSPAEGGVPQAPGLYAWWVRSGAIAGVEGPRHPQERVELLYVGIAPSRSSSKATLRSRVCGQHLRGNIGSSTFRQSLAALLADAEGWSARRRGSRALLEDVHNRALSQWQRDNLRLAWAEHASPWEIEHGVIAALAPPLNLAGNKSHPLRIRLSNARKALRGGGDQRMEPDTPDLA